MSRKERRPKCTKGYHEKWETSDEGKMPSLWNNNVQNWSGLIPTNLKKPDYRYYLRIEYFYRVFAIDRQDLLLYSISTMPDIIQTNPKILSGQPVIRGTRIPVARVMALIGMGYTLTKLKRELPDLGSLTKKDIAEILSYYQIKLTT